MNLDHERQLVQSVFHPSDFSEGSRSAFAHALALALVGKTEFTILHVADEPKSDSRWQGFPPVRQTLEAWGMLEEGSPRSAVFDRLEVDVRKVEIQGGQPTGTILAYLDDNPTDLIVLATRGAEGAPRWISRSVAEPVARRAGTMTLFVPQGCRGFVDPASGGFSMRRILLPVDHEPDPTAGVALATRAARLEDTVTEITLLHAGETPPPELDLPEDPAWRWTRHEGGGDAVESIVTAAQELPVDLIVMVTAGREGILDALRGTTTERVLRRAPCPVLAIPVESVLI